MPSRDLELPSLLLITVFPYYHHCISGDHIRNYQPPVKLPPYLSNLYAGQEATVRTGHGTRDWFKIGKGVCLTCRVHQTKCWDGGITSCNKTARRNINKLRYADDTTLKAEGKELMSLLMRMKEENEKSGLKLNIQKTKILAYSPITSWQIDG